MAGGCCLSRKVRLEVRGQHGRLGRRRANTYFRAEATGGKTTREAGARSGRWPTKEMESLCWLTTRRLRIGIGQRTQEAGRQLPCSWREPLFQQICPDHFD